MARLVLAPMEGLTDVHMRDLLTRLAGPVGYDWCVTEFIRVTDRLLPARTFYQYCPELLRGGRTATGTPVHVQLLGSEPAVLADNAALAVALGAPAIDLNFGCPAKTVNRHRGGAVLLDEPELVHDIVRAVRAAVPSAVPVSAKMRLGVQDHARMLDNARAIESAGARWLTVHARTKADGYRPPAHWHLLAHIRAAVRLPVLANGDIWTPTDAMRCRQESACDDLMLGRGAVIRPDLIRQLRGEAFAFDWRELLRWQQAFLGDMCAAPVDPRCEEGAAKWTEAGAVGRYKQWLAMLTRGWPEAVALFDRVKRLKRADEIRALLAPA